MTQSFTVGKSELPHTGRVGFLCSIRHSETYIEGTTLLSKEGDTWILVRQAG